jgi:AraC-like DNA-binding protein
VRSVVYCRSELGAPWGLRVAATRQSKFHLVLAGTATLEVDDGGSTTLRAGDLVLLPRGSGHVVRDRPRSGVRDLDEILEAYPVDAAGTLHYGGSGPTTLLVCGAFDTDASDRLLDWLPPLLVLDTTTNGLGRWLEPMLDLVRNEEHAGPGDAAVIAKVADVFLTDALRYYVAGSKAKIPTLPVLSSEDPAIADAVAVMHGRTDEPWTIESLSRQVGMSRSSFASRFQAVVGSAPIAYLTELRLARAAGTLATSTRPLSEIAQAAGYDNESSFSKAFTRHYGQPPGQYRRQHQQSLQPTP